jgi:hypothetical protein
MWTVTCSLLWMLLKSFEVWILLHQNWISKKYHFLSFLSHIIAMNNIKFITTCDIYVERMVSNKKFNKRVKRTSRQFSFLTLKFFTRKKLWIIESKCIWCLNRTIVEWAMWHYWNHHLHKWHNLKALLLPSLTIV